MTDLKEICRLVELNKELIINLCIAEGYHYLLIFDEMIQSVFESDNKFIFYHIEDCPSKQGVLLCLEKSTMVLQAEERLRKLKVFVLLDEYHLMEKQISVIKAEHINAYRRMFGYSSMIYEGKSKYMKKLQMLDKDNKYGSVENPDSLCITEYIDTRTVAEREKRTYTLGIRQFLFELEVLANFPVEIQDKQEEAEQFKEFTLRFCDIFRDTGWRILFSEHTPFSERIIKTCGNERIGCLENVQLNHAEPEKVMLIQNGNLSGVEGFYRKNKQRHRIVVRRFIVLFRTWIMENLCEYFKDILAKRGVSLYLINWNWAMNHPLFPKEQFSSNEMEEREKYGLYYLKQNLEKYESFLKGVYEERYSQEYVKQVFAIPDKILLEPGKIRHENKDSRYINVMNGERHTSSQPVKSQNTIYMMGGCVFFGYAVEDAQTIPSFLQKNINERISNHSWKVVNLGIWGGNIDQAYKQIYDLNLRKGDIIIVSYAGYMPLGKEYKKWDISTALNHPSINETTYFNSVIHCNDKGYRLIADKLFFMLKEQLERKCSYEETGFYLEAPEKKQDALYSEQARQYLKMVKEVTPPSWKQGTIGAIVMNCNPFTLGHKYLISESASKVDHLYIFVVEEDKSYFPFQDRIQLVREGTKEFANVLVVPSGTLMISSVTFPGYFLKDSSKDIYVDTAMDVDIFARYIAGPLRITKRFVGEEPIDVVTHSYNESMKIILPHYGIQVDEIARKETESGVISASSVRKALDEGDFKLIRQLVPESTLTYLETMVARKNR